MKNCRDIFSSDKISVSKVDLNTLMQSNEYEMTSLLNTNPTIGISLIL